LPILMLDYLIAISLVLLTFGHALLIRGCFSINQKLGPLEGQGGAITENLGGIGQLIDELCEIISDFSEGGGPAKAKSAPQMQDILGSLITNMMMPDSNGPQSEIRTVQKANDTQTKESSTENNELSAELLSR
jgi:hypothetical protein